MQGWMEFFFFTKRWAGNILNIPNGLSISENVLDDELRDSETCHI